MRLLFTCICYALIIAGCNNDVEQVKPKTIAGTEKAEFVNRQLCVECHEEQSLEWTGSHHDLAMDYATDKTVLGDFNNSTFTGNGVTSTFFKKDGKFFVRTDGPDGKLRDYEISYVLGIKPLQQYMIKFPDGRIQLPDIGWDNRDREKGGQRWIHLQPDENITPKHVFHWTGSYLNWNYMCGECHTTNFKKNYDLETNTFKTTWSEIDVSCQACHGPGSNHVTWARSREKEDGVKYAFEDTGLLINLKANDPSVQIEACARCHARRSGLRGDSEYGGPFMDSFVPEVLIDPFYYPDGQALDEVYVYGSFIQSKKYKSGVKCTDCHNPHTARLNTSGNKLCIGCHNKNPKKKFSGMASKNYDSPDHHFHKEGSPGALCVECHMPETTYMITDPRRDHGFRIPRPDLSLKLNIPNPCNRCHTDKSSKWAAANIDKWYPESSEKRKKDIHFSEIFAAGRAGRPEAKTGLFRIIANSEQPAIIRATALNILSGYSDKDAIDVTALYLMDDNPLIRYETVRGISALIPKGPGEDEQEKKYSLLAPLLKDPIRAVRAETARALTEVPAKIHNELYLKDFERAIDEYKEQQESMADRPESHLNMAILYENRGQVNPAESSYKTAIRLANGYTPARFNLANLYISTGRNREAEQQFMEILKLEPENGHAYYSLGLLFAETNRLDEAVSALEKAVELVPDHALMRYNYSLALRHIGRNEDALAGMLQAYKIDRNDTGIVQALAIFYIHEKQWKEALPFTERLAELAPGSEGPKQMLKQVRQAIKSGKSRESFRGEQPETAQ